MNFNLNNTFTSELPADPIKENTRRQVTEACYSYATPRIPSRPKLLHVSKDMAQELGLTDADIQSEDFVKIFSGAQVIEKSTPYAMCYGGHQFGHWARQLGDGRAINLAEVDAEGQRWALQLKGAGETPYSRTADGLAVLRSSIREHLCSEAMFALGAPTTRSLSLCLTGDEVLRDMMYDGNAAYEKGAVVCRVAPSFIRFGNFQIFTSREDIKNLKLLTDYTIRHFYSEIKEEGPKKYVAFLRAVADCTLSMIIHWQRVGFVHGVMNTDNMSILGLTIDYGPYGWLEGYNPNWTPNTTDRTNKRYRFGNQAAIAHWNIFQLANALYPLVNDAKPLEEVLKDFQVSYRIQYQDMMHSKLGLTKSSVDSQKLIELLDEVLQLTETDMTIFYRLLSKVKVSMEPAEMLKLLQPSFYSEGHPKSLDKIRWENWLADYRELLLVEDPSDNTRKESMNSVNPKYVFRNYMAQLAIDAADSGDYSLIDEMHQLLKKPYDEQIDQEKWFAKRPEWARTKVGCSMLSCSS